MSMKIGLYSFVSILTTIESKVLPLPTSQTRLKSALNRSFFSLDAGAVSNELSQLGIIYLTM